MELKTPVDLLLLGLTLLTGVCPLQSQEINVLAGEMAVLQCPHIGHNPNNDSNLMWTSYTVKGKYVTYDMSSAEQRQMVIRGRSLVILRASINHQGNYSCSLGNTSSQFWFRLIVNTAHSAENEARAKNPITCYTQEFCMLKCPDVHNHDVNTLELTDIEWHKEGEILPKNNIFSSVGEEDQGFYTCARLYRYHGQIYNMTFKVLLEVKSKGKSGLPQILSPNNNDVFYVDLGSMLVINCEAVVYSEFDEVFWISGTSFVETNDSFPVFYNSTREDNKETASLIFKSVSQVDLSKHYICKLESASEPSSFINITLAQKAHPFPVALSIVCILLMILVVVVVVVYMQFKTSICLFLRDTLGFHSSTSDGKRYDAFLMYYRSHTDAGLDEDSRQCLESVLEGKFNYSLCLYDRNVLPGRAEAETVLASMEQSRAVVLVPTSDFGLESGVLNEIHGVPPEWQIRFVFIKTEMTVPTSGSLPEALELLDEAGSCVTWKGPSSMTPSSSFFKQLRYSLPAPRHASKMRILPHSAIPNSNC